MSKLQMGQADFSAGYNTRDDSLALSDSQCLDMVNCFPAAASVRPRNGIGTWAVNDVVEGGLDWTIIETFGYQDDDAEITIFVATALELPMTPHWAIFATSKGDGQATLIKDVEGGRPSLFNFVRIKDSVFCYCSTATYNFILDRQNNTTLFTWRPMWINRVQDGDWAPIVAVDGSGQAPIDSSTFYPFSPNYTDSLSTSMNGTDAITLTDQLGFRFMYLAYGLTLVRREDTSTPTYDTVYYPGVSESALDLEKNVRVMAVARRPLWGTIGPGGNTGNFHQFMGESFAGDARCLTPTGEYAVNPESGEIYKNTSNVTVSAVPSVVAAGALIQSSYSNDAWSTNQDVVIPFKVELDLAGLCDAAFFSAARADGATHLRVYRTLQQTSFEGARGATLRFSMDLNLDWLEVTIGNLDSIYDFTGDAALSGSDNTVPFIGTSPAPDAFAAFYNQGRVWVGGNDQMPGRVWYSVPVGDPVDYLKYMSHFDLVTGWVECNHNSGDKIVQLSESQSNLIILMQKSAWILFRSILDAPPRQISSDCGIVGRRALVRRLDFIYYLSQKGPAMLSGDRVDLIQQCAAGELWPRGASNRDVPLQMPGNFFDEGPTNQATIVCGYQNDALVFAWQYEGETTTEWKVIAYRDVVQMGGIGCCRVVSEDANLNKVGLFCQIGLELVAVMRNTLGANVLWSFLKNGTRFDNATVPFEVSVRTHKLIPGNDLGKAAELWDMLAYSRYEDSLFPMTFEVTIDDRYTVSSGAEVHHWTDSEEQAMHSAYGHQFVFQEGTFGQMMDIRWRKMNDVDFDMNGILLRYFLKSGPIPRFSTTEDQVLVQIDVTDGVDFMSIGQGAQPFIIGTRN